mgnify:CR=1 FL=1
MITSLIIGVERDDASPGWLRGRPSDLGIVFLGFIYGNLNRFVSFEGTAVCAAA